MIARIGGLLVIIVFIHISTTTSQNSDRVALQALTKFWKGTTPSSWVDGSDPCDGSWLGITCTNSRVTSIILVSIGLTGGLSGDIGQLTELVYLDLSYNTGLTGSLTPEIGKLARLTNLVLVGCSFNGLVPDTIGNLERLIYLSLNSNGFTGSIPANIGRLKNLTWLDLSDNRLTGSLPVSDGSSSGLDMLTNTKYFHLGQNQLSGDIPLGLFNSKMTLVNLLLDHNRLTGSIPTTVGLMHSLKTVRLDGNFLSGDIPSNISDLTNVTTIYLSNNILSGSMPNLTSMNLLKYLDLSNNSFDASSIPAWFSTLQSLTTLKLHLTNLIGLLPAALFSIPQLQNVDLSNNRIMGPLDISSNPSKQLELVDLQDNRISSFTQRGQTTIEIILLDNTICTNGSTDSFCNIPKKNSPPYSTPWNNCTAPTCDSDLVPSPNCQCAYPYTGVFKFKAPSFSMVTNETTYSSLHDQLMSFFRNATLPVDSLSLKNPTMNLEDYLEITLEVFPSGGPIFNTTAISRVGSTLSNQAFKPTAEFNTYTFKPEIYNFLSGPRGGKGKTSIGIIIGSAVGGCVLVVLLVLAGVYAVRQKGRAERAVQHSEPFASWDASKSGGAPQLRGAKSFTFEELRKLTSNFSKNSEIGTGGYGKVYKGSLTNGEEIAIKRAGQDSAQGEPEFKTELELLSRVHHKNVVRLIGFCYDQSEQMLVYEYIVNGTLKDGLSGSSGITLDWMQRLKIILGAARGLQYLHDLADPPIIHRDIKTNNILLDQNLVAKVADFGISTPFSDTNKTHVTTQVKGTMGYLDPEYFDTQQLTEKSDVYSFGIVMFELITARNPIEKGKNLVKEVKKVMDKNKELYNLQEMLDPNISLSSQLKGLEKFVDLSLRCVEKKGEQRPEMSEIVKEIESILTLAGLDPASEPSTSTSYEGTQKD